MQKMSLKNWRIYEKKISQAELGQQLQLSQGEVAQVENGRKSEKFSYRFLKNFKEELDSAKISINEII